MEVHLRDFSLLQIHMYHTIHWMGWNSQESKGNSTLQKGQENREGEAR